jgi:uncharacterized protein
MRARYVEDLLSELCFAHHKIGFVSGPRQCGKTTMAKRLLRERQHGAYFNWDQLEFRRAWAKAPQSILEGATGPGTPLIVLDEIHKARQWKRTLKGIYDTVDRPVDFLVTGSARLSVYRRGSDSLLGRYRAFRLHPFSVGELSGHAPRAPEDAWQALFAGAGRRSRAAEDVLDALMEFGPFPEPVLARDTRRVRLWRRERVDAVVREDLRDLSRILELDRVQMLAALLPERASSLLSVQSLREDLEVGHETVRRWLSALAELYYLHEVKPHTSRVRRSLRKEGKLYLWDWGEVPDRARRFENLVAGHLLKACHAWTDGGWGEFDLRYVRNRDGREIDFLLTRDGAPWLPVEAKIAERRPSPSFRTFVPSLRLDHAVQIVLEHGVRELHDIDGAQVLVVSAADALTALP